MEYKSLINKISASLQQAAEKSANSQRIRSNEEQVDDTENILNKIGLEIQRQGGYNLSVN